MGGNVAYYQVRQKAMKKVHSFREILSQPVATIDGNTVKLAPKEIERLVLQLRTTVANQEQVIETVNY